MTRVISFLACVALLACGDDDGGAQGTDGGGLDGGSGTAAGEAGSGGSGGRGGSGGSSGSGASGSGGAGLGDAAVPTGGGGGMTADAAIADASIDAAIDGGGTASDCENGTIAVEIDGTPRSGCVDMFHTGGLNHVIGTLDDDSGIVVNFTGTMPDEDVCVSVSLRKPGNASNDWDSMTNGCDATITEYDASTGHVVGTFAATVDPSPMNDEPARELTNGAFDVQLR